MVFFYLPYLKVKLYVYTHPFSRGKATGRLAQDHGISGRSCLPPVFFHFIFIYCHLPPSINYLLS